MACIVTYEHVFLIDAWYCNALNRIYGLLKVQSSTLMFNIILTGLLVNLSIASNAKVMLRVAAANFWTTQIVDYKQPEADFDIRSFNGVTDVNKLLELYTLIILSYPIHYVCYDEIPLAYTYNIQSKIYL